MNWPPPNLVHIALAELDPKLLTSPDDKNIQVSLEAICRLLANPPPMLQVRPTVGEKLPKEIRVGVTRFQPGVDIGTVQDAIDRLYKRFVAVDGALGMGLQLSESGKHGDGENCPTCHFVQVARKARKL